MINKLDPAVNERPMPYLALAARIALGCVFIFSGFNKATAPKQEFAAVIESYYILSSQQSIMALASILPWMELIFGIFLLTGYLTRVSAGAVAGMLSMFIAALAWAKLQGIPLDNCGCFGNSLHIPPTFGMLLDAIMIILAALAYRQGRNRLSIDNWVDKGIA